MASINLPSKGKKKSLDSEITLVPFVDFLSICICFLLMTAVWIEVAQLNVKQAHGTAGQATTTKEVELDVVLVSSSVLKVQVKEGKKVLKSYQVQNDGKENLFDSLKGLTAQIIGSYKITMASVTTSSKANHEALIQVLDSLRGSGIEKLGVNHGV